MNGIDSNFNGNGRTASRLRPKHQRFVDELFNCEMNATRAYVMAGYSSNGADGNAARLMMRLDIKIVIRSRQEEVQKQATISRQRGLEILSALAENGERPMVQIRAIMVLAKLLGWDKPQPEPRDDLPTIEDFRELTREERMKLINKYGGNAGQHLDEVGKAWAHRGE